MSDDPDERNHEYFTLVFKGNICAFKGNPLQTETPFGVPVSVAVGDVMAERDELEEKLEDIRSVGLEIDLLT